MTPTILLLVALILPFFIVIVSGAPYLPTRRRQVEQALDMLKLKPGQTLLELGCGDGTVIVIAAKREIKVIGYEVNPFLWFIAWVRTRKYRKQVQVYWGDFWSKPFPSSTDAVYVFLIDHFMGRLHKKLLSEIKKCKKCIKVASYTFSIPDKKPEEQKGAIYLYKYSP